MRKLLEKARQVYKQIQEEKYVMKTNTGYFRSFALGTKLQ